MEPVLAIVRGIDPLLLNALTFLVGLIAGHHIALVRDKRQEFNAAIAPLRAEIIKFGASADLPGEVELDTFERLMWPWQRKRLRDAIKRCRERRQANTRIDEAGGRSLVDTDSIEAEMVGVLNALQPR